MSADGVRTIRFEAGAEDRGKRIDQVLAAHIPELSRRKARVLLDIGGVFVDKARVKVASRKVWPGQIVEAYLGGALERATAAVGRAARQRDADALPRFSVVFEDEHIVVVDKPAGLLTAPTPEGDRQNLAALLGAAGRPSIFVVHRIDLMTSGLLVFAKTEAANRALSARFREHDVEREYIAVVAGTVAEDQRVVRAPVKGRAAISHVSVRERIGGVATLVAVRLETGRTHQIRVHMSLGGHPVLGDNQYGQRVPFEPPRMALHATSLGIVHPATGELVRFISPLPAVLADWLDALRRDHGASPVEGVEDTEVIDETCPDQISPPAPPTRSPID